MEIRRVVTGYMPDGSSGFKEDSPVVPISPAALAGLDFFMLWATDEGRSLPSSPDRPASYWPGVGGTRFLVVRWMPKSDVPQAAADSGGQLAEAERQLPGLLGAFEPGGSGFHTSESIDYGVCLDGEMWLTLDGGREVAVTPGTCVVQRGTRHAWENRSDRPAVMLFVLAGADPGKI
jgi:quercetin dioxygenase-like cupin family protein